MTIAAWFGLAAAGFVASVLQATNGFGFAVLAVPFFLIWAPPGEAIPIIVIISFAVSLFVMPRLYRFVNLGLLWRLTLGSLPALLLVSVAFADPDQVILRAIAGTIVTGFAILLAWHRYRRVGRAIALRPSGDLAVGVIAGIAIALVGMAGPPPLIYLMLGRAPLVMLRATLIAFFAVVYPATLAVKIVAAGVPGRDWLIALSLLPILWIGGRIGLRVGERLGEAAAAALALIVLAATGLYTLGVAAHAALW